MDVSPQRQSVSAAEAENRLRYVRDVRSRTRRAAVMPVLAVGTLGALVIVRGLLLRYWPHVAGVSAAWFFGVSAFGLVAARSLEHRQRTHGGVLPASRGRLALVATMFGAEWIAHVVGANVIVAGLAAALSLAAWRAGMRTVAVATAAIAIIINALVLRGTPQWAALVIFGAGLMAVGIVQRQTSRHTA